MTPSSPATRRRALAAGLLAAALVSCGRDITAPGTATVNAFRRFAAFAFSPEYETAVRNEALHAALTQVAFERVRITLRREDGTIALDTVVDFPAGADQLTLALTVPLPASAPASGVPLSLNLGYVNAAGDTVFKGGPIPLTVLPSTTGSAPPPPVQVPVHYTGTGANATEVVINPKATGGIPGQGNTFTAQAITSTGQVIAGTPVVFTSSNPAVVQIADPSSGNATFVGRGVAFVYAQLLTGPKDSAVVTVTLPASAIVLVSGGSQTAPAGTALPQPIIAQVRAADGVPVAGVTVNFAAAVGAGSVSPASAVSGANGQVSASWTLGTTAGAQSMTVTSAGLSGSPITVNATAQAVVASKLVMKTAPVNGTAGSTLAAVAVTAQDALGNIVTTFSGDVSVALGSNPGGATLGGTTTVAAVNGVATFSNLTLNRPGTAYTLVFSSGELTRVTSTPFDVIAGSAAKLVFGPMPSTADAGIAIAPPLQVTVQDAAGNTATSFTGEVTVAIGNNAGGSTLSGTLKRSAVAGVAAFNDLSLNKKGASYTLVATAAGVTNGTSAPFNVAPGAPVGLSLTGGGGQSAAAGSVLSPITVQLRDAYGNGIEGASIAFAVTGGGGTLSAVTAVTDVSGTAIVLWTIGSGAQTMTATFTGIAPVTVTATSTTAVLQWTGAASTDWNAAGNWSPAFVPASVDAITIPVTTNAPIISAPVSIGSLVVVSGATLTNNSTLTVNGSVDAGTTITGSGSLILTGSSGALRGVINQAVTISGAAYTLSGATQVTGPLTINASGKLTVGGQTLTVTGGLATSGSGRLAMASTADVVTVSADATFAGGSTNGLLTAGVLTVNGNFTATGSSFSASGSHMLKLVGASTPQTLAFTSPISGQGINHLTFDGAAPKWMSGSPQVMGNVSLLATSAPVEGETTVRIGGNFSDATILPDSGGYPNPLGGWRVMYTDFFGSNKTISSVFITSNVTVSGTVQFAPCASCLTASRLVSVIGDIGYVQLNGDLTVSGTGALLKLNGNEVDVGGNFATASGGALQMTDAMDYLYVAGSATFAGGSTAGRLTDGTLEVMGDFTQSGAADSFAPGVGHYTYIGDPYGGPALRASRARALRSGSQAVTPPAVEAARRTRQQQVTSLRAERAAKHARLDRRASAYARLGMAAPSREQSAERRNAGTETASWRRRPARAYSGTPTITFANPSTSFFGTLYLSGPEFYLASDVLVAGELETGYSAWHQLYSSSATPRKLTSHGADVRDLGFDNVSWNLLDGSDVETMDYVEFSNMDPAADQFTIARTSDELALCDCSSYYDLYYWNFTTTPTTGHYIKATDTNGGPNVLELYMTNPNPSSHGGHVATAGGALISYWPETDGPVVVTWLGGTSTDWNVASNWSGGVVPTSLDDVLIPSAAASDPVLTGAASVHNLTIESGKTISMDCRMFNVYGNVVAPLGAESVLDCDGDYMRLVGDGGAFNTVVGNFATVKVLGNYQVSGPGSQLIVRYMLSVEGTGNLTVNGGRVDVGNLSTSTTATLTMTNAADQVFVGGTAAFNGGSSSLTAGTLTLTDGSLSAGANYFAPSGTHTVVFAGTLNYVSFANPAQSFLQDAQIAGGAMMYLSSDAQVNGTLSRGTGTGLTRVATANAPSAARLLKVNGLNQSGADAMQFENVMLSVAGSSAVTFNNASFIGYGSGFTGSSLFEVNRASGSFTFTGLNFSAVGFGADTTRHYVKNAGTANITLSGATPSPGVSGMHFIAIGGGTVTWP